MRYLDSSGTQVTKTLCTVTVSRGLFSAFDSYACSGFDCVSATKDECSGTWHYGGLGSTKTTGASLRIVCDSSDDCEFARVSVNMWVGGSCPTASGCGSFCSEQGYTGSMYSSSGSFCSSNCRCTSPSVFGSSSVCVPCTSSSPSPPPPSPPPPSPPPPSSAWSLQNGDSLTLSSNSCSAAYNQCQATCAQGYSVSLSSGQYMLSPTASSSSLPSGCSCYTLGPATPTSSTWSGSIPVGPGAFVQGTVTETSASTYTVVLSTTPSPCTLTYSLSPPTASLDTTQNCKCSCCTGNSCSASIVASYDASSSSTCGTAECRLRFPTVCPASGQSGIVSASYSASTTTLGTSTSTSDATRLKIYASSLAVAGTAFMFY